jgi:hypothetical protein
MISLALALLVSAQNDTADSREAYARCLKSFARTSLEQKMEPGAFDAALGSACKDKEALLKTALTRADLAMGIKAAASSKSTAEQLTDYVSMAKEDYRFEFEAANKPKP